MSEELKVKRTMQAKIKSDAIKCISRMQRAWEDGDFSCEVLFQSIKNMARARKNFEIHCRITPGTKAMALTLYNRLIEIPSCKKALETVGAFLDNPTGLIDEKEMQDLIDHYTQKHFGNNSGDAESQKEDEQGSIDKKE